MSNMSNQPFPPVDPADPDDDLRNARGDDVRRDVPEGDVVDSADADVERSHERREGDGPVVDLDNQRDDTTDDGEPSATDTYVDVIDGRPETLGVPAADGDQRDAGRDLGANPEGDLTSDVLNRGDDRERGDNLGGASRFDERR